MKYLAPLGNSDHSVIIARSSLQYSYRKTDDKYNYNKGDYDSLRQSLDLDWDVTFEPYVNDIESMWNIFKHLIINNSRKYIPLVKIFKCPPGKKWSKPLPDSVRKLVKKKSKAWKKCFTNRSTTCINTYKRIRNEVRKATWTILRTEQNNISKQCISNPKKFWNYIKTKTKNIDSIGDIKYVLDDGLERLAETDEEKANVLCDYFSSIFNVEKDSVFDTLPIIENLPSMPSINFGCADMAIRLKKLNVNKSEGPDGIHPRVLSENSDVLAYPWKLLFEKSFRLSTLPLDWRSGNITTIHKKGSKLDAENYRLVSLTCICCKIMESILRQSITDHLTDNNVFNNNQFGFIKGRSTVMQLLKVMDIWTESLESGGQIDVIYTDLKKAFDKVPHNRLISKLYSYKINPDVNIWIKSFLFNRRQRVRINGIFPSGEKFLVEYLKVQS